MTKKDLDKKKKIKNYLMLAAIFGWIALIWAVTMIRIGGNG